MFLAESVNRYYTAICKLRSICCRTASAHRQKQNSLSPRHISICCNMKISRNKIKTKLLSLTAVILCIVGVSHNAAAFDLSTYAETSRLASGRWVKISVEADGIYLLTNAALKRMGFNDPSKVHVYGYGGRQLPDHMTAATFYDDLPMVQTHRTDRGILFYGEGTVAPVTYTGRYVRPKQNPYSESAYYFVSDVEATDREIPVEGAATATSPETSFVDYIFHEKELVALANTGSQFAGEDFMYTPTRTFNFTLKDIVPESNVWMACSFMTTSTSESTVKFTVNNEDLASTRSDVIAPTSSDHGNYRGQISVKTFKVSDEKLSLGISLERSGTVSAANLDYLAINYVRSLKLSDNQLIFTLYRNQGALQGATAGTIVWDITTPLSIVRMNAGDSGSSLSWTNEYTGSRRYIAFDPAATFPEPKMVANVANQNLHGVEVPDMVIFSPAQWMSEAQRLADFHQKYDGLKVLVVDQKEVFNEFGCGNADVNAFRKMLKMLYDRSATADRKLKYALFFGRGSYDNRRITTQVKSLKYEIMPLWQSEKGETDNESYTTDDIFAFLRDNSGSNMASDYSCIGVGRMPVTSVSSAKLAVDKVIEYSTKMASGTWRNRTMLLADDQDLGVHMEQMELVWKDMLANGGDRATHTKLYIDQYPYTAEGYPQARDFMFKTLEEGVSWWFFIGHANTTSLTHESLLTLSDINNMYLRKWPIFFAATCEFLRWDSNSTSAGEIMWGLENGGCIAQVSANRPVYISENAYMSRAMASQIYQRDENGRRLTIGEMYRRAKNSTKVTSDGTMLSDSNKLRYILMGDPAMYPAMPQYEVVVDRINGVTLGGDEQAIMKARQDAVIEGHIEDTDGITMSNVNGTVSVTLYDADQSVTTRGNGGEDGKAVTFEQHGDRLFAGNDSIKNGKFTMHVSMPSSIVNNFREATMSLVAKANGGATIDDYAAGVSRDFYVYGTDDSVVDDTPPVIKSIYLNHPSFRSGDHVNTTPMLIAEISDNRGINMNTTGIGHQMHVMIDGNRSYSDVAEYYTPAADGSASGIIAYQLPELTEGEHSLRLRIWDTSDNSNSETIEFYVTPGKAPVLYDVYSDANPATSQANFYLSHDRPDSQIEVTVSIYDMLGQPVWESTTSGRSDMYLSSPVTWNLLDRAGHRVNRGIYLYRASIKDGDTVSNTQTKRIAVTGR